MLHWFRCFAVIAVTAVSSAALAANEPLPILADIPPKIAVARPALTSQRESLQQERSALHGAVTTLNADCLVIHDRDSAKLAACTNRKRELSAALVRHIEKCNAFNSSIKAAMQCVKWSDQLAMDRTALERQQKTIAMGLGELESWRKANEDAQNDAVKTGAKLLLGAIGAQLQEKINSLRSFKGALTRYRTLADKANIPFEALEFKIENAARGYVNTLVLVTGGQAMEGAGTLIDTLTITKNEVSVIGHHLEDSDASVRELLNDRDLKALLETDSAAVELTSGLLVMAANSQQLAKLQRVVAPGANLASFAVDYGYDITKWLESRARIIQQYQLSDLELKAVAALKSQIECTVQRLQECETASNIGTCERRDKSGGP